LATHVTDDYLSKQKKKKKLGQGLHITMELMVVSALTLSARMSIVRQFVVKSAEKRGQLKLHSFRKNITVKEQNNRIGNSCRFILWSTENLKHLNTSRKYCQKVSFVVSHSICYNRWILFFINWRYFQDKHLRIGQNYNS
jgi:hypothetical protein